MHYVTRVLNYFKQNYPYKLAVVQAENPLGYNGLFISMVGSSSSRLDVSISQIFHVKMQTLISNHLISKCWVGIYSDRFEDSLPQDVGDESDPITPRKYLASMTAKMGKYARYQLFHAISRDKNPTTVNVMYLTHNKVE